MYYMISQQEDKFHNSSTREHSFVVGTVISSGNADNRRRPLAYITVVLSCEEGSTHFSSKYITLSFRQILIVTSQQLHG